MVQGSGPSLLGRDWLAELCLDWKELHRVHMVPRRRLQTLLESHPEVFKDELGTLKYVKATIHVDSEAKPRFCRPRSVPYALRGKVAKELERLEQSGVIEPVPFSDWAAPIIPVVKGDGTIRI